MKLESPSSRIRFTTVQAVTACFLLAGSLPAPAATQSGITVSGTDFLLDGRPFPYTGVSFFNAIYNPAFTRSQQDRMRWLEKFQRYGINVLRVWGQWDNKRGFVDACATCTLYHPDGRLRMEPVNRLKEIARDANRVGTVINFALFARESWNEGIRLDSAAYVRAASALARELMPHRNIVFQVWNEHSAYVPSIAAAIKAVGPKRLVTNSPGYGGDLGDDAQNRLLDFLTPHTSRNADSHWEIAPREIALLIEKYRKPVVDDEPARTGTRSFGGPRGANHPSDHILRMYNVWRVGGYVTYHHDMFQTGLRDAVDPAKRNSRPRV